MRTPARLLALLALAATACSGNNPQPPQVVQVGWSWDPARAGVANIPVAWISGGSPQALPLLPATGCTASGSAQAVTSVGGTPVAVGIAADCVAGAPVMVPVSWDGVGGQSPTVTPLPLPSIYSQGTALAVAWNGTHTFVAGATGNDVPYPTIWVDGVLATTVPTRIVPAGFDAAVITSLVVTDRYGIAAGVAHRLGGAAPVFAPVVWVLDTDFTDLRPVVLLAPPALAGGRAGGSVAMTSDGLNVYSAAGLSMDGRDKPVFWLDTAPFPIYGGDFSTAPWGVPTGLALVDVTPYVTGFSKPATLQDPPEPVIWTPADMMVLSTADGTRVGSGEAIAVSTMWAFVTGESHGVDPTDRARRVSVPALWTNGDRQDLPALVAPGGGPELVTPLDAWWKVPGTGSTEPWPWPGGFGEVITRGPVAAAGSAVARAIVTIRQ